MPPPPNPPPTPQMPSPPFRRRDPPLLRPPPVPLVHRLLLGEMPGGAPGVARVGGGGSSSEEIGHWTTPADPCRRSTSSSGTSFSSPAPTHGRCGPGWHLPSTRFCGPPSPSALTRRIGYVRRWSTWRAVCRDSLCVSRAGGRARCCLVACATASCSSGAGHLAAPRRRPWPPRMALPLLRLPLPLLPPRTALLPWLPPPLPRLPLLLLRRATAAALPSRGRVSSSWHSSSWHFLASSSSRR